METLITGSYTYSYNGVALGVFEGDQGLPTLEHTVSSEPVGKTSAYGDTVIDEILKGGNVFYSMTCIEYKAGPKSAFWPYHATFGQLGTIGVLMYGLSAALVATSTAGTPAAASPATQTLSKCILAPGFTGRLMYGPTLRKVPLRFRVFPFPSGGNVVWLVET